MPETDPLPFTAPENRDEHRDMIFEAIRRLQTVAKSYFDTWPRRDGGKGFFDWIEDIVLKLPETEEWVPQRTVEMHHQMLKRSKETPFELVEIVDPSHPRPEPAVIRFADGTTRQVKQRVQKRPQPKPQPGEGFIISGNTPALLPPAQPFSLTITPRVPESAPTDVAVEGIRCRVAEDGTITRERFVVKTGEGAPEASVAPSQSGHSDQNASTAGQSADGQVSSDNGTDSAATNDVHASKAGPCWSEFVPVPKMRGSQDIEMVVSTSETAATASTVAPSARQQSTSAEADPRKLNATSDEKTEEAQHSVDVSMSTSEVAPGAPEGRSKRGSKAKEQKKSTSRRVPRRNATKPEKIAEEGPIATGAAKSTADSAMDPANDADAPHKRAAGASKGSGSVPETKPLPAQEQTNASTSNSGAADNAPEDKPRRSARSRSKQVEQPVTRRSSRRKPNEPSQTTDEGALAPTATIEGAGASRQTRSRSRATAPAEASSSNPAPVAGPSNGTAPVEPVADVKRADQSTSGTKRGKKRSREEMSGGLEDVEQPCPVRQRRSELKKQSQAPVPSRPPRTKSGAKRSSK